MAKYLIFADKIHNSKLLTIAIKNYIPCDYITAKMMIQSSPILMLDNKQDANKFITVAEKYADLKIIEELSEIEKANQWYDNLSKYEKEMINILMCNSRSIS